MNLTSVSKRSMLALTIILLAAFDASCCRGSTTCAETDENRGIICPYTQSKPVVDGRWSFEGEWANSTEIKIMTGERYCVFRLKHDGYNMFVLVDLVYATSKESMCTEVLLAIDVEGQGGIAPQPDDYLFRMIFTNDGRGIAETIFYDVGNGLAWVKPKYFTTLLPLAGYGVGNFSKGIDPYSGEEHWVCEMQISLGFLGPRNSYGFYLSAYNNDWGVHFIVPGNATVERPETWGRLIGFRFPELQVTHVWPGDSKGKWIFPKPGEEYYMWALVQNTGAALASGYRLSFRTVFEEHPQTPEIYCGFAETSEILQPGESKKIGVLVPSGYSWLRKKGQHSMTVAVNEDRSVPELNYTNNRFARDYLVDFGYIFTVKVPYRNVIVKIDGKPYASDPAGEVNEGLLQGRHLVEMPQLSLPEHGVELTFTGFGDGHNKTSRMFNLTDDMTFDVRYNIRFLIEVEARYGSVSGAGWLPKGSAANLTANPTVDYGNRTRMVFVKWILPGNVSDINRSIVVNVNGPKRIDTVWKKQFHLKVMSEYGSPRGEGWYDRGVNASFWVERAEGIVIVRTFIQWIGDANTTAPKATVKMDAPKQVEAVWSSDYLRLYIIITYVASMAAVGIALLIRMKTYGRRRLRRRHSQTS